MTENNHYQASEKDREDLDFVQKSLLRPDDFAMIIKKYREPLARYCFRLTGVDPEEIEDLLQEIFLKAYLNLNDFDQNLKFSSWIYRIAHNHCISYHRKNKARPQGWSSELTDEVAAKLAADFDLEKEVDALLLEEKINVILDSLDKKYREVLVLKFILGNNYQEISDIIKKPIGTVGSLINKAKKKFKSAWREKNLLASGKI